MSNSLLSPTIITRKAIQRFINSLGFANSVNRQYDQL